MNTLSTISNEDWLQQELDKLRGKNIQIEKSIKSRGERIEKAIGSILEELLIPKAATDKQYSSMKLSGLDVICDAEPGTFRDVPRNKE